MSTVPWRVDGTIAAAVHQHERPVAADAPHVEDRLSRVRADEHVRPRSRVAEELRHPVEGVDQVSRRGEFGLLRRQHRHRHRRAHTARSNSRARDGDFLERRRRGRTLCAVVEAPEPRAGQLPATALPGRSRGAARRCDDAHDELASVRNRSGQAGVAQQYLHAVLDGVGADEGIGRDSADLFVRKQHDEVRLLRELGQRELRPLLGNVEVSRRVRRERRAGRPREHAKRARHDRREVFQRTREHPAYARERRRPARGALQDVRHGAHGIAGRLSGRK